MPAQNRNPKKSAFSCEPCRRRKVYNPRERVHRKHLLTIDVFRSNATAFNQSVTDAKLVLIHANITCKYDSHSGIMTRSRFEPA